jgi:hypothetical protein
VAADEAALLERDDGGGVECLVPLGERARRLRDRVQNPGGLGVERWLVAVEPARRTRVRTSSVLVASMVSCCKTASTYSSVLARPVPFDRRPTASRG